MFINVRAFNPGHAGTFTPGRFWPNGHTLRLEVVDDRVAAAQIKPTKGMVDDPAARALKIAEGPFIADGKPDPERITRSGFDAIKGNQHLSILADEESQGAISQAAVDAARAAAAKANADLTDAKIYAAELEAEVDQLTKANADLTGRVAELEAAAAKANADGQGKAKKGEKPADKDATGEGK